MTKTSYQQKVELLDRYIKKPHSIKDVTVLAEIKIDVIKQCTGTKSASDIPVKYGRFQDFVDRHFRFCQQLGQGRPRMGKAQGKAMNDIIGYLMSLENADNSEDKAYNGWEYILAHWRTLPEFIQRQVTLPQINKHIEEITYHFKNARKKGKFDHTDLRTGYNDIDQMYPGER